MQRTKLLFKTPLIEGLILSRPNRFIFNVRVNGEVVKCHCPSTGQIASIKFENIPCLLSRADNPERKTKYTAEAISLDAPEAVRKNWIGINQNKANEYIEFFLKSGQLSEIFAKVSEVKREVPLGKSRIDLLVNNRDYVEIKTPLKDIPSNGHVNYIKRETKFVSFDRLVKHFDEISKSITGKSRAIIIMCRMYDAVPFVVPTKNTEPKIINAAKKATKAGMEHWQVNLKIDPEGVELLNYVKLNLF